MARLEEMFSEERLSDNTQRTKCEQCEDCVHWGSDVWGSRFDKASCDEFPYPDHKPSYVIGNAGECPFRKVGRK